MKKAFLLMVFGLCAMTNIAVGVTRWFPDEWETPENPNPTIQEAIDDLSTGDTLLFVNSSPRTWSGPGNVDLDFSNGLPGGQTRNITLRHQGNNPSKVTIDCGNSARAFIFNSGETENAVIAHITIINGYSSGNGGAIYCESSSPLITNCVIKDSSAGLNGGGIYCQSASPTITNTEISYNTADYGGGIYCGSSSSPTITNSTIIQNTANYDGGGIYNKSSSLTIDNSTVGYNNADYGGGIYCELSSSLTITNNSVIHDNTANDDGGGIYSVFSSSTITDSIIRDNVAEFQGGGIRWVNCSGSNSPVVTDSNIIDNSAGNLSNLSAGFGGGIHCDASAPTITGCTISGNEAIGDILLESLGGGLECVNSSAPVIDNCLISYNWAVHGGGLDCWNSTSPIIRNSTISNNLAVGGEGGGILLTQDCNGEITNCNIYANSAGYVGGGIDCIDDSAPIIKNCLIVGNTSYDWGGGIHCWDGVAPTASPTIINCDIIDNITIPGFDGPGEGGGIYSDEFTSPTITNCILWFNSDVGGTDESAQIHSDGGSPIIRYNCIQDNDPNDSSIPFGGAANGNTDDNPRFVRNPSDGGDGWGVGSDDFGDLHLQLDSGCIEAGDPNFVAGPNDVDMDSQSRVVNTYVDIGADETTSQGDFNGDAVVDLTDLSIIDSKWLNSGCFDTGDETAWCSGTDINQDSYVNVVDFTLFAKNWRKEF